MCEERNMITVDARGDQCPIPVIKTKKVLDALTTAEIVQVLVDNEIAVQNVTRLGTSAGGAVSSSKKADKEYEILIHMAAPEGKDGQYAPEHAPDGDISCIPDRRGDTIVVVNSATMGIGNDELGKVLMKGFIFAISQLDTLPKKMLFYNGGVTLTTEGSASLEDLKSMEAQGVEIYSCGTCLDYYNMKDQLSVGSVTNMYSIVEAMNEAGKIIRP